MKVELESVHILKFYPSVLLLMIKMSEKLDSLILHVNRTSGKGLFYSSLLRDQAVEQMKGER